MKFWIFWRWPFPEKCVLRMRIFRIPACYKSNIASHEASNMRFTYNYNKNDIKVYLWLSTNSFNVFFFACYKILQRNYQQIDLFSIYCTFVAVLSNFKLKTTNKTHPISHKILQHVLFSYFTILRSYNQTQWIWSVLQNKHMYVQKHTHCVQFSHKNSILYTKTMFFWHGL